MSLLKKIASSTLAALLLATLPAGSSSADEGATKNAQIEQPNPSPGDTLLKVNGKPITRHDLDRSMNILLAQSRDKKPSADAIKKASVALLEQLTNAEILYQAAQGVEIKDLEKRVEKQLAENRAKFSSDADFEKSLVTMQMTRKELEEFTRRDIVVNNLIENRFSDKAKVTESEAKKYYDDNRARYFEKGDSVKASHILIGAKESASPEEKKQAKDKAEALLKRAKAGEDFAALAKAESSCASATKGGDLGEFSKGKMVPPFEKVAFAMKPGEISEVVETKFGYHIIKLVDVIPARTEKYENMKEKIVEYLKRQKIAAELPAFIKELKDKAKIEKV